MSAPRLGRYVLEEEIGRGGMGVVYRARHPEHGLVAVKTFDREAQDPALGKRLRREAGVLARLDHPNVCRVLEAGEEDGRVFIAMELLEGESLAQVLRRGPVVLRKAASTTRDVLSALSAVHELGIVHRDIKPSNVLLTPSAVKVVDFGLAKRTSAGPGEATASEVTQAGRIVGTPNYMSPEQIRDQTVDERSDLFSVGAVLFEMIAGRRAFAGRTPLEVTHSILEHEPPALGGSPAVAVADRVIRRALEKKPGARYASAAEMSAALEEAIRVCGDEDAPTSFAVTRLIVLPFRVTPPDPDREPLAHAVPDGITTALSSLDSVIVRSPSLARKLAEGDLDFPAIASAADVDVALTGSMLSAGDRVRVECQLVRVPEGTVEWSHKTDLQAADFIELLDRIVDRVVGSLSLSLTTREQKTMKRELPGNPAAFECFVRANLSLGPQLLGGGERLELAIQLLRRATEEDPEYAHAWARLAHCYWVRAKPQDRGLDRAHAQECLDLCRPTCPSPTRSPRSRKSTPAGHDRQWSAWSSGWAGAAPIPSCSLLWFRRAATAACSRSRQQLISDSASSTATCPPVATRLTGAWASTRRRWPRRAEPCTTMPITSGSSGGKRAVRSACSASGRRPLPLCFAVSSRQPARCSRGTRQPALRTPSQ